MRINPNLFGPSAGRWHAGMEGYWCILTFRPEILAHDGVVFSTTNNMYTGVQRAEGAAGLNALFRDRVTQWQGKVVARPAEHIEAFPTCIQAEALYPKEISISFLQCIYTRVPENLDSVKGLFLALGVEPIHCEVRPEMFTSD